MTGIPEVDDDHAQLDHLFRGVEKAIFVESPQAGILALYDQIVEAIARHFGREEDLLADVDSFRIEEHREVHRSLLAKARAIRDELAATTGQRSLKALFDIEDDLYRHTVSHDLQAALRCACQGA
ncbi:MAG: hemerythrin family protein [Magnetospirillum sp. WYHS-4]